MGYTFEECDARSKAEFRLLRESVGLSVNGLAAVLGIRSSTIKDWELPSKNDSRPSPRAWEFLDRAYRSIIVKIADAEEKAERGEVVTLRYARRSDNHDDAAGMRNAVNKAIAFVLTCDGTPFTVEWED